MPAHKLKSPTEAEPTPVPPLVRAITPAGEAGKRALDVVGASLGVLFLLPLLVLIAVLIKLDSPGPVFFRQKRVAKGGGIFRIFKFRTMVDGAYLMGSRLTLKRDPRITRLGRLLRWSKMDELPQLFNVILGDMSLIGPRPEDPHFVEFYSEEERGVLTVRPGIVGPSQIVGRDEADEYPEGLRDTENFYVEHILPPKLRRDLEYVRTCTFWGDVGLLVHGVWATVRGAIRAKYFWRRRRSLALMGLDLFLSLGAYLTSLALLLHPGNDVSGYILTTLISTAIIRPAAFAYFGCYHLIPYYFGLWDLVAIFKAVLVGSLSIASLTYFAGGQAHPRSIFVLDGALLMSFLAVSRYALRNWARQHPDRVMQQNRERVIVAGAGISGEHLSRVMIDDPRSEFHPIGFIDEAQERWGSRIHGIKVLGGVSELRVALSAKGVRAVFVCMSDLPEAAAREIADICAQADIPCRVVPRVADLLSMEQHSAFSAPFPTAPMSAIERSH